MQRRKRVYQGKTRLPSENVPRKGEKAFTERKRRSQRRKRFCVAFAKTKMCLPSENTITERKHLYQAEVLAKGNIHLTSENVTHKVEKAFTNRICLSQRRNSIYRAKTSLAKAKTILRSVCKDENVFTERKHDNRAKTLLPSRGPRKGKNTFNERKCDSQS